MIARSELDKELAAMERQRTETLETLSRIDGALQLVRHLIDKSSAKAIQARKEADEQQAVLGAADAGSEQPPA